MSDLIFGLQTTWESIVNIYLIFILPRKLKFPLHVRPNQDRVIN